MASKLSPFVYWGQSNETVSLKVDLRNVENVEVTLTKESLDFSAQGLGVKGNNKYNFHLDFYLPVDPEKSRYRKTDLAVEFQIEKLVGETWPRLTEQRIKLPWLKIDFDKFPLDDSDEDVEVDKAKSFEEMQNKMAAELENQDISDKPTPSQTYLFLYNLFQFVGYTYIFITLMYNYVRYGESARQAAFEGVGTQMMTCQALATLEIFHSLLGLVKSNVLMALVQVLGRNFILFILILQEPRLQISSCCWYLFAVWALAEVIRYPFYMFQILDFKIRQLTWLRYNMWIILYPLGIIIEATIVFQSISYFGETNFFSIALPNSGNIAFHFPYFLIAYLALMCFGSTNNLKYMYLQRQKQLYISGAKNTHSSKNKYT
ncbi:very-long-chain (3R)-3-hydroxyacyl-CoA dehydratase 3-like [Physella acuta]|uniref:very-long-chain (3R)-3-hydroxyacyl-CoA dehydratase 3-like n=1 Tax=Physella acuta TaxID=109671 RepID=UPI0027DCFB80|nr:very-long-chain (3R)-3-hydroxyacyl-CoA dehydratase 3-like [Physella acuta]